MTHIKVALVDANNLMYRWFFGTKNVMRTPSGEPSSIIFCFAKLLNKLLQEKYTHACICFDSSKSSLSRREDLSTYKANRTPPPQELLSQIKYCKELVEIFGFYSLEKEEVEADDIISYIAQSDYFKDGIIHIFSNDKDFFQLINNHVFVLRNESSTFTIFDANKVIEKIGCPPSRVADFLGISGDSSDNVPGIPGIGPKGALEIINNFSNVKDAFNNIEKLSTRVQSKLLAPGACEMFDISRKLVDLNINYSFHIPLELLKIKNTKKELLYSFYKNLGFNSLIKESYKESLEKPVIKEDSILSLSSSKLKKVGVLIPEQESYIHEKVKDLIIQTEIKNIYFKIPTDEVKETLLYIIENSNKIILYDLKNFLHICSSYDISISIDQSNKFFDLILSSYIINPSNIRKPIFSNNENSIPNLIDLHTQDTIDLKETKSVKILDKIDTKFSFVLADMEKNGVYFNKDKLLKLKDKFVYEVSNIETKIFEIAGEEFNIGSTKQLNYILFEKLNLPKTKKNKNGYSTDTEALQSINSDTNIDIIQLIIDWRFYKKNISTYIDGMIKRIDPLTGRIHSTFQQTGTITGRISSKNPNLQNIPTVNPKLNLRSALEAQDKNYLVLTMDYSQIELRMFAALSQDKYLIDGFRKNIDIHTLTASIIYNKPIENITNQERSRAKNINFSILFGQQAFSLSKNLQTSYQEAKDFISKYFERFPTIYNFIIKLKENARILGYSSTFFGRRRQIPELFDSNKYIQGFGERVAVNTPVQGTAADFIKLAMIDLHKYIKDNNIFAETILQIHDEIVLLIHKDHLNDIKNFVNILEKPRKLGVTIKINYQVNNNWI